MNDLSEQEQLDELKAWWAENRAWILGGIIVGLAIIFGLRWQADHKVRTGLEASAQYEALVNEVSDNDLDAAREIAASLFEEYGDTAYAGQGRLAMARLYMDRGRDADAASVLEPLASDGDGPLSLIARLRLAKIYLYQDKAAEALALLEVPEDSAFHARFQDAIGDAHYALGDLEAAATAYQAALDDVAGRETIDPSYIQMKLADVRGTQAAAQAAESAAETSGDEAQE